MTLAAQPPLTILVADDEPVTRRIVASSLQQRFMVLEARDGAEAVALFEAAGPDLVLLDVSMPGLSGVEAAERIRALARERYVPILLFSSYDDVSILVDGLRRGADDFLPKPFNPVVFNSKLDVFLRQRAMQLNLKAQMAELSQYHELTEAEHHLAQQVFARLLARGLSHVDGIQVHASPMAVFNGDVVLSGKVPGTGAVRWMLADVSGHGLSGALGTIPLSTVFYGITRYGASLEEMVRYMDEELAATLPSRFFSAAIAMEIDAARTHLQVINAGMPPGLVVHADGTAVELASRGLPLGIEPALERTTETLAVLPGDRVYCYSDGVVDARSPAGECFGLERIKAAVTRPPAELGFEALLGQLTDFSQGSLADDTSVITVTV